MDETHAASDAATDIINQAFGETSVVYYTASAQGCFEIIYISLNVQRVLGIKHEACVGYAPFWQERIHSDDLAQQLEIFAGLARTGSANHEFRLLDDQNNLRWLSNEVAFRPEGAYLAGCLRDISVMKNLSKKYAYSLHKLNTQENFYLTLLDSLPLRLFWKDRNSVFRGCNLNGARALNLASTREIIGKTDDDFCTNRLEAILLRQQDQQLMTLGQVGYHAQSPASESVNSLEITKVPLFNEQDEVCGLLISHEDVSALKNSERSLNKFKRAVEQSLNCIFIADVTGNIDYVNPAFLATYGYEAQQVMGKSLSGLNPEHSWPDARSEIWQGVLAGKNWSGELANRSRTGTVCWHASSLSPIVDELGEVTYLLAIENNITERKQMEQALAENESRLREITSTVGEGIFVVDTGGAITFVNPAAAKQLGWSVKNLLGKNAHHTFNCKSPGLAAETHKIPDFSNHWMEKIKYQRKALRSESQFFRHKDGSQLQVSIIATPIYRGAQFSGAVVAFHDITEQKFTQKLLNETLQELRTVLDNAQIGVTYVRKNEFSWTNKHMESMFGYSAGALLGKPIETIYAKDAELDILNSKIVHQLAKGFVYEQEWLMKKSTGELFWCHQRGVAIDANDLAKGSIWIMLDIDRLKNTEHILKAMNGTLTERVDEETRKTLENERMLIQQGRNAAMGEMIGNIAHQWRQPLSTLGLVVQNIYSDFQESSLSEGVLKNYVEAAKQAISRMSCTIDDFRDFFRPNRVKEHFSLHQAICDAIQLLDAMLKNHEIVIHLTGSDHLKTLGHPNEFSQVILNFMTNAKDALVERKISQGHIDIDLSERDGWGVVSIRDNAGGIDSATLHKIYDPYFTTKTNGTGIGLYINKTIIEKHMDGHIVCHNQQDGAEFTITIPLQHEEAAFNRDKP